ncbi:MAG: hypothetical protein NC483_06350 [Ruminococcus sp.]|nr:hypothetical protein [Ruminococcus sp.]
MNRINEGKKALNYILKNGDLYDVIAKNKGVNVSKHPFLRANLLLLSRILYGGLVIFEKIKAHFVPIAKVKKAQDTIRNILGFNVDIVRSKNNYANIKFSRIKSKAYLSCLYGEENRNLDNYINNLEKLSDFCNLYKISRILLRKTDINSMFVGFDFDDFNLTILSNVLDWGLNFVLSEELLELNNEELIKLITILKGLKSNKQFILSLGNFIEDITIKDAIKAFLDDNDIERLQALVKIRLDMYLNSEAVYKDKIEGKVFKNIVVDGEYLKALTTNKEGKQISNTIMSLYDYLEVLDYNTLLEDIKKDSDDKEIKAISALYLYLCNTKENILLKQKKNQSFYDYVYENFKNSKNKRVKGLYTKVWKNTLNVINMGIYAYLMFVLVILLYGGCVGVDFINTYFFRNENANIAENVVNTIIKPYKYSLELELGILDNATDFVEDMVYGVGDKISASTGDALDFLGFEINPEKDNICVGYVTPLTDDYQNMPDYYTVGFATSGAYNKGQVDYEIYNPELNFRDFENVTDLFSVRYDMPRNVFKKVIQNNQLNLNQTLYPLGDNFVITRVEIRDVTDGDKLFIVDYERAMRLENSLTLEEMNYLKTFRRPEITYIYGISYENANSFVENLSKEGSYTELTPEEAREAITKGLGLDVDTNTAELFATIWSKYYSLTPIKDAGLSREIKKMTEKEYYEAIASMDSLICNMAASLAVELDEELIYVVGYHSNSIGFITSGDAHAWAMRDNGVIVDITPSTEKVEEDKINNLVKDILEWGMSNKIPVVAIGVLITLLVKALFGKKIVFNINLLKVKKLANEDNIEEAYAKIKEVLYGGTNIPIKKEPSDFVETISDEFAEFTKEELNELKKELKKEKIGRASLRIIDEVPFIRDNEEVLKRVLAQKKTGKS